MLQILTNNGSPDSHNELNTKLNDNPLDQYICATNKTILVKKLVESEFVSNKMNKQMQKHCGNKVPLDLKLVKLIFCLYKMPFGT